VEAIGDLDQGCIRELWRQKPDSRGFKRKWEEKNWREQP